MRRSRIDSRIEVWGEVYVNNPHIRSTKDQEAQIEQIEKVDSGYIVEVFNTRHVAQAPTTDKVNRGKWLYKGARGRFPICECSICGNAENADWAILGDNVNYCPNCGAKMDKED